MGTAERGVGRGQPLPVGQGPGAGDAQGVEPVHVAGRDLELCGVLAVPRYVDGHLRARSCLESQRSGEVVEGDAFTTERAMLRLCAERDERQRCREELSEKVSHGVSGGGRER